MAGLLVCRLAGMTVVLTVEKTDDWMVVRTDYGKDVD